jgi:hypothetical protein
MLINGGVAGGMAKEVDDATQLIVEAMISTATDASTAGTARIAGSIVSAAYMLTRKGHDVMLTNHTVLTITLNRPLMFSQQMANTRLSNSKTEPGTKEAASPGFAVDRLVNTLTAKQNRASSKR